MEQEIIRCLEVLRKGGTILYPTDTVWGIGCDATNKNAVEKIFKLKQRTEAKSLIVLIDHENLLNKYVRDVPGPAWELIELATKPLTIIYDKVGGLADNVIAENGSAGIRVTTDAFCKKLIYKFGKPIVSTSANISNSPAPKNFRDINPIILQNVDYVVNLRQEENNNLPPSTIIKLGTSGDIKIIRN